MANLLELVIPISRGIVPVTIILGTIGNSLNVAILTRSTLYRHSCSHYFLALAINNLIYCTLFLIIRLLTEGQQYNPINESIVLCKIYTFALILCIYLSPAFIILASIDRYRASSPNAERRNVNQIRMARYSMICLAAIIMIFLINTLVAVDIQPDGLGCVQRSDSLYKQVYGIIQVLLFAVIARLLMILFGLMTIYNIKQVVVAPIRRSSHRRTEGQLARMLILQVSVDFILTLPSCITYLISILPTNVRMTAEFLFAYSMGQILFDFSYATTFILYILTASIYKKELKLLFYKIYRRNRHGRIQPTSVNSTATHT